MTISLISFTGAFDPRDEIYTWVDPWPRALGFKESVEVKDALFKDNKPGLLSFYCVRNCRRSVVKKIRLEIG